MKSWVLKLFKPPLAALLLLLACAKGKPPAMAPPDVPFVTTADGWTLPVRHYPPLGRPVDGPPVLLVHGMSANHFNWDYRPEVSLAWWLRKRGWDVWVAVLRGDPGSRPPEGDDGRSWTFDAYATEDLPAVVDGVLARTGHDRLLWVGHSMGGILLWTALATYPDRIAAGVAISSPARLSQQSGLHHLVRGAGRLLPARGHTPSRFAVQATRGLGRANPVLGVLANRDNMDPELVKGISRFAIVDLPFAVNAQVRTWLSSGQILDLQGQPWVRPAEVPVLAIAGGGDRVVPPDNVVAACEVYADCQSVVASGADGFAHDYGHIDIVLGETAPREIYPLVGDFLADHAR